MAGFASTTDMAEKAVSFDELGPGLYAYTAEGDPNSGIVVGKDGVVVVDAQATPAMAQDVMRRIAAVTDRKVAQVVLSHYHAVRVLGASGYGAHAVLASDATHALIEERGRQDMDSEIGRFPRLFRGRESIPGLTWPTHSFDRMMTLWLGGREAQVIHIGRAHTAGDTVVWLPEERVLFAGDTVEFGATPYCGDAHFADWPETLRAIRDLGPEKLVPGRDHALLTREDVAQGLLRPGLAHAAGDADDPRPGPRPPRPAQRLQPGLRVRQQEQRRVGWHLLRHAGDERGHRPAPQRVRDESVAVAVLARQRHKEVTRR